MEQRFIDILRHAKRWNEGGTDFMPVLGCSKCGAGCMPLCGLGMNPNVSPMEARDITFKTRKTMLEVGHPVQPVTIQIVTATSIVVQYEAAMECVEERITEPDGKNRLLFIKPIPTVSGLLCQDCSVCQVCMKPINRDSDTIRFQNRAYTVCLFCSEQCKRCSRQKLRHHPCCVNGVPRY
jgi:hypothetical protein